MDAKMATVWLWLYAGWGQGVHSKRFQCYLVSRMILFINPYGRSVR